MTPLDWIVLFGWIAFLVSYGLWRGRGSTSVNQYLLAGKTMPWYAMGLSIMATQASAITFISTTGQAYVDGMRFVQFYFGLPVAMVLLSATAVPIFHRAKVYTAYEYLEQRFDAKTRLIVAIIFLIGRGLGAGVALAAPAIVMSVMLDWPFYLTTILMGGVVILFTTMGGIKAVTYADVQQMMMIMGALILAALIAIWKLPHDVSFLDAIRIAGAAGRLNAIDTHFDPNNRYNLWSGLIGSTFLMLAYFGTDQSQVQRYLTGRSIGQSRLGLLLNAMAKVPVQFFILFIGAIVFVFFIFERPPLLFQPVEMKRLEQTAEYPALQARYQQALDERQVAARQVKDGDSGDDFRAAQQKVNAVRSEAAKLSKDSDTNYIFLSFVKRYLPRGLVGLILGVILTATMSASSGEINSLATVSMIDVYRRHFHKDATDRHYLLASRVATVFWGVYAVTFANFAQRLGSLIEAVNQVGSLFYGSMLGVFVVAFFMKRAGGNAAFWGVVAGQATTFAVARFTPIAYLWYNMIGCLVVLAVAWTISAATPRSVNPGGSLPGPA
jgi:Na+/proline symporter